MHTSALTPVYLKYLFEWVPSRVNSQLEHLSRLTPVFTAYAHTPKLGTMGSSTDAWAVGRVCITAILALQHGLAL
jgi:hypothetical protein